MCYLLILLATATDPSSPTRIESGLAKTCLSSFVLLTSPEFGKTKKLPMSTVCPLGVV